MVNRLGGEETIDSYEEKLNFRNLYVKTIWESQVLIETLAKLDKFERVKVYCRSDSPNMLRELKNNPNLEDFDRTLINDIEGRLDRLVLPNDL